MVFGEVFKYLPVVFVTTLIIGGQTANFLTIIKKTEVVNQLMQARAYPGIFRGGAPALKVKGKGLGTCYSAAYETRTTALYILGSGN